tara:strand:+ start:19814 stop:20008 length:195 start_codon:yes stop_codon:yes gene_type:complete
MISPANENLTKAQNILKKLYECQDLLDELSKEVDELYMEKFNSDFNALIIKRFEEFLQDESDLM